MTSIDERPAVWIGHMFLATTDIEKSAIFMSKIGMRNLLQRESIAIFELRGGTHVIIRGVVSAEQPDAVGWDIMVDDIDASNDEYGGKRLTVSAIRRGSIHDNFDLTLPDGRPIEINSSHAGDRSV